MKQTLLWVIVELKPPVHLSMPLCRAAELGSSAGVLCSTLALDTSVSAGAAASASWLMELASTALLAAAGLAESVSRGVFSLLSPAACVAVPSLFHPTVRSLGGMISATAPDAKFYDAAAQQDVILLHWAT